MTTVWRAPSMPAGRRLRAVEILRALFPKRYDPHQMGFALAETLAHVNHLWRRGEVERWTDGEGRWRFGRR